MPSETDYPRFFDVLCAAVVTLWLVASASGIIFSLFQDGRSLLSVIVMPFMLLFALTIPAFIFGGLISFPFWWLGKRFYRLNKTLAGLVGGFTGFFLTGLPFFFEPRVNLGTPRADINLDLTTMVFVTLLCAISGWNGYRVAWNGRRRKTKRNAGSKT